MNVSVVRAMRFALCCFGLIAASNLALAQNLPAGMTAVRSVEGIDEYRLPNGLQILLIPDNSKPTTTVNMTYHVGSRQENYGETGMAHLLEHLMFKGSPDHPQVWAEFSKRGLRANGSTSTDRTNYFASLSANDENLKWFLGWHADAMTHSFIARKDLDTEMTVVRNEMESGENSPVRILIEKTLASMYQWHNYGKSTIGARSDVENVDIPRLQAFYRTYYQPDNATLIVSGKFEPAKVLGWVAEAFGPIPKPQRVLPKIYTIDPAQDGERLVTVRRVGGAPVVAAAYHVPAGADPDYPAVELLSLILTEPPAGRLHKRLVEQGPLASSVFADSNALADPGYVLFGARLTAQQSVDAAADAMVQVIESLGAQPITEPELARAKSQWLNDWERGFDDPERVGLALSESVAAGDWRLFFLLRDRVRATSLADVQRVAVQRFVQSNRTQARYVPTDKPVRAPAPAMVDVAEQMRSFVPAVAEAKVAEFDASPANIDKLTQRSRLASGLQVALLPKATRGQAVHATLVLHFGAEKSLLGLATVGEFTAALLDKGTSRLTRQQIRDRMEQMHTEIVFSGSAEGLAVGITSRRDHMAEAVALVAELLKDSTFPSEALEEVRRQRLTGLQSARDNPQSIVGNRLDRAGNPYPRGDVRYSPDFDQAMADVNAVKVTDLQAFQRRFYGASHAEFAAVGDLDVAAVQRALEAAFGGWRAAEPYERVMRPLIAVPAQREVVLTPDKQNAVLGIRLGMPLNDDHPDYPALTMANYIFGAGGDSRLWKRIREKEGLSYGVRSSVAWSNRELNSTWSVGAIFAPQNRDKVEAAFKEELARALTDGFTDAEVESARQSLLSYRRLSRAQDGTLAASLAGNLELGRTFAVSQKVDEALAVLTREQVNAALRRYVSADRLVQVLAGDFK